MQLTVGQKVAYPSQGPCLVETLQERSCGERTVRGFILRVLGDNSTIFIPEDQTGKVGLRPLISQSQCRKLIGGLAEDFDAVSCDWKTRSREFMDKLQSGDVFQAADVLKKLTFLSHEKKLSFREQTLLEKAKFLIISEIRLASGKGARETDIVGLVEAACTKHTVTQPHVSAAG
jgi:CarD family transcriptional regulator